MTEEAAEIIPEGLKNNIRWNLGHVYVDQYLWLERITQERTDLHREFIEWFGYGTSPENFELKSPGLQELRGLLGNQISNIRTSYGGRMEKEFPPSEMGIFTVEQVLIRTIFHEGMHLQKIIDIKTALNP